MQPDPIKRTKARIVKVIDGDTVRVRLKGGPKRDVRFLGIDTPEVYGGRECGGSKASKALKKLLPTSTRVMLVSDRTQDLADRYKRLLRYVMKGKVDASKAQIRVGMSKTYTYAKRVSRYRSYKSTEKQTKRSNRGLWKTCWK